MKSKPDLNLLLIFKEKLHLLLIFKIQSYESFSSIIYYRTRDSVLVLVGIYQTVGSLKLLLWSRFSCIRSTDYGGRFH